MTLIKQAGKGFGDVVWDQSWGVLVDSAPVISFLWPSYVGGALFGVHLGRERGRLCFVVDSEVEGFGAVVISEAYESRQKQRVWVPNESILTPHHLVGIPDTETQRLHDRSSSSLSI